MIHFSISNLCGISLLRTERNGRKEGRDGGRKEEQAAESDMKPATRKLHRLQRSALCLPSAREADGTPKAHSWAPRSLCPAVSHRPKPSRQLTDAHSTPLSADEIKLLPSPPRPAPPLLPCFCLWLHSGSKSQRCLWCGVLPALILFCHVS